MIQTVEVVAAVAAKVGPNPSPEDLDMVVKVVASQQNGLAESGMSLKESKRMSKLLSDLVRILRMESLYVYVSLDSQKRLSRNLPSRNGNLE